MPEPEESAPEHGTERRWRYLAHACGLIVAGLAVLTLAYVPLEVSENLDFFIDLQQADSAWETLVAHTTQVGVLRPVSWATAKVLFDAAGDSYFLTFRAFNAMLIFALTGLFVHLLHVRNRKQFMFVPLALMVLVGMHPMHEAVRETALNMKLMMPVAALLTLAMMASAHRIWKDIVAVGLFAYCLFSNELGIVVWVVLVGAWLVGFRGVSPWAVAAATGVLACYLYLRFGVLPVGAPGLSERSSGFGLQHLDPAELQAAFGENPLPFYAYNVVCAALGVLLSEPRNGTFMFVSEVLGRTATPWMVLYVVSSAAGTLLLIRFAARRFRRWLTGAFEYPDKIFLIFVMILGANAVITYPWLKDVTLSTGGVFYALALFFVLCEFTREMENRTISVRRAAVAIALVAVISLGWSLRGLAFFVDLHLSGYKAQQAWVTVYEFLDAQDIALPDADSRRLVEDLRRHQLGMAIPRIRASGLEAIDPYH